MPKAPISPPTPTRAELDAALLTRAGTLEETPYPILLLALAVREESAVLELRSKHMEKDVVFDEGSPVECRSNIATETLGRFLVASGRLSEKDCHTALNLAASRTVPLGEILTERELLTPTELDRTLQQNLGRKLLEPFRWKRGTWKVLYDVPPATSALRVKVPQLLVTGIMKIETQEAAEEAVAFARRKYLAIARDPLFGLGELRLSSDQRKVVDAAHNGRCSTRSVSRRRSIAQNGTYAAEAIWCRYELRISPPASALKMLRNALRIDPNCAMANLYVGKLHAVLGNQLEAEAYLNRAAVLMPNDRHGVEVAKGLK
ncbi:MAG TPA: DUF4388 domain-containing protein [Thermoanaerobaculia bacterium]|nr:DUF4388 domain-containing protein [Thermoanaerobaculia bacterium]